MFDKGSELKQYFTILLKDYHIKPVLTSVNNPQANAPVEKVHQVTLNMLVTKDLDNKVFDSMGDKSLLSQYFNRHASPSCIWKIYAI